MAGNVNTDECVDYLYVFNFTDTVQIITGFPRLLDFFLKIPGPGKALWSWKVLEKYPENCVFFIGSNGKQAEIVNVPVCVDFFYLLK